MQNRLKNILEGIEGISVVKSPPFSKLTTIGTGGEAAAMLIPLSLDGLRGALKAISVEGIPYFIFGGGSNILVPDEGIDQVSLSLKHSLSGVSFNGSGVVVEAGTALPRLSVLAAISDLSGLEELSGIPGSVGGAVMMNAGSFGRNICEFIRWLEIVDREGRVCRIKGADIQHGYRQTVFPVEGVVSRLYLELQRGVKERIFASMRKMNRMRKMKQPWGAKTFGSVFKNPEGGYAGKLIEEAGLSGLRIGDAEVSKKHANFIVNRGKAKSRDIDSLIKYMEKKVREENGIALEREVRYVGW